MGTIKAFFFPKTCCQKDTRPDCGHGIGFPWNKNVFIQKVLFIYGPKKAPHFKGNRRGDYIE